MISLAVALRWSCGLRLISSRPELSVMLEPSTPMKEDRLTTSGSFRMASARSCWWRAIAEKEVVCAAWVTPWITPVSWTGKNPFGMTT